MHDPRHDKPYPPVDYDNNGHGPAPGSVISGSHHSQQGPPPPQTVVTMNTDPTPGARVTEINLNIGYFKTLPGILKLIQLVRKETFSVPPSIDQLQ